MIKYINLAFDERTFKKLKHKKEIAQKVVGKKLRWEAFIYAAIIASD